MPDIDKNSVLDDEENMYSNDPGKGTLDSDTGKIKHGDHSSKKDSGLKKI